MGREIRRVAMDFNWKIGEVWSGFLNPLHTATQCSVCNGNGYSADGNRLKELWYGHEPFKPEDRGSMPFTPADDHVRAFATKNVEHSTEYYGRGEAAIEREARRLCGHWNCSWSHHLNEHDVAALVAGDRLYDLTHTFDPINRWKPKEPPYLPTPREVNVWSCSGMGHDSINQWICVKAECARLGVSDVCCNCGGDGEHWPSSDAKQAFEDWTPTPPPEGDGYQVWSTTSEGHPMTPVCASPEALARYCVANEVSTFGSDTADYKTWLEFIAGPGWAPSAVMQGGRMMSGILAVVQA